MFYVIPDTLLKVLLNTNKTHVEHGDQFYWFLTPLSTMLVIAQNILPDMVTSCHVTGVTSGNDLRSLDPPLGVPLVVRMRNRKLCNTRSSGKQCWLGVFSTTSASYNHRKPCKG
jgi:hypothetical protein